MTANSTKGLILGRFFNLIVYRYLKTFIIMAKLKFLCDVEENDFIKCELDIKSNGKHSILITSESYGETNFIWLDKSTAIKFAKALRTEINKIQE